METYCTSVEVGKKKKGKRSHNEFSKQHELVSSSCWRYRGSLQHTDPLEDIVSVVAELHEERHLPARVAVHSIDLPAIANTKQQTLLSELTLYEASLIKVSNSVTADGGLTTPLHF